MPSFSSPSVGSLVRVRQRTYLVEGVQLPPGEAIQASPVVRLACVDDDALGQKLAVIWNAEVDAREIPAGRSVLKTNAKPDDPKTFAAYLHALRWACVSSTDSTLFQSPLRAGIVPKTYQLEPLRKALLLPRVNLFIADDVGLGKTIEAGLVLQELLLRQRVDRVVIACPASVLLQWRDELNQRFGLSFAIMDKAFVNARRRERGFGVNAWSTHRFFIVSHNLLRSEEYLRGLREWLLEFAAGSLFILDEAHAAAPSSQTKYAIDSQTTHAVRDIARRFEHRLFLSATPHNGHSNSFSALLEILDPQRFTRGVPVTPAARNVVMVRRLKSEIRKHSPGESIPIRHVQRESVSGLPPDAPELLLAAKLAEYTDIIERRLLGESNRAKAAGKLVTIALQKRLLSSIEAFARTLQVHRISAAKTNASLPPEPEKKAQAIQTELALAEESDLTEEQSGALDDAEVAAATRAGARATDDAAAQRLLIEMGEIAERNRSRPDAKVKSLLKWIAEHQCPGLAQKQKGAEWKDTRLLIFTEYTDTKKYLIEQLGSAIGATDRAEERILGLGGGMDEEDREAVKSAFNSAEHPVRILVATDAAREGVNLQAQCATLFHFDLPWNPARMEQRNGRIDRLLQPAEHVYCHYFVYEQRPEDTVLDMLVKKTERIHAELGSLSDVIDEKLADTLKNGISRAKAQELCSELDRTGLASAAATATQKELESERDPLSDNFSKLQTLYDKAIEHLGGDADKLKSQLKDVVDVGLRLAGYPALTERSHAPGIFDVPRMDTLAVGDLSWREIMDSLRAPRTHKMPDWEWRAKFPPRPISFEPATTLSAETVQLHLQHKLVQRALAQFRSQAFGEDQLSRIAIVRDPGTARPRVLALGRLSVYGHGAARLHEEILVAAAFWVKGTDPDRLKAFVEESKAEEKALATLLQVLTRADQAAIPTQLQDTLMQSAQADEEALWATLKDRAARRHAWAIAELARRGEAESAEMKRILESQRERIDAELLKRSQLAFHFTQAEHEQAKQYAADTQHIEKRRAVLEKDIDQEPARLLRLYEVQHFRLERVGLVYLWPDLG